MSGSDEPVTSVDDARTELERHRARVFDALSRHSDPLLREMGKQLAHGTVAPHDLVTQPRYAEVLLSKVRGIELMSDSELHRRVFGRVPAGDDPESDSDPEHGTGGVPAVRR